MNSLAELTRVYCPAVVRLSKQAVEWRPLTSNPPDVTDWLGRIIVQQEELANGCR